MESRTLNVGNESYVMVSSIEAILSCSGKKLMNELAERKDINSKEKIMLHDCTKARMRKSVIVTKDGTYYVCALTTKALNKRLNELKEKENSNESQQTD